MDQLSTLNPQLSTKDDVLIVLTTWPDLEKARAAARQLVEERLVACASIVPAIESIYRWQDLIETNAEVLIILKTTAGRYSDLETRIRQLHSYEVPEIVGLRVAEGLSDYLRWVEQSCGQ